MELRQMLTLDEQLAEGGMPPVRVLRGEYNFGIADDEQAARPIAVVDQANAPDFEVVFRWHDDFHFERDIAVAALELGFVREERDRARVGLYGGRMVGG